ncbi:MAG TPA: acyltransferase [Vicinamibacterales bacterium]|nr:acyltransferase [Vicinamibacterales bacterium]
MTDEQPRRHWRALDGLRGVAILLVLLHHFTVLRPVTAVDAAVASVPLVGWVGVDLFFVLSGFLITGILIDARGGAHYFQSFYARRALRIFPLYYLVVFLSLIVLPRFAGWHDLLAGGGAPSHWPYWVYLTNFAIAARDAFTHGILDVTWSLAIEEQFYLLWPALIWLCPPRLIGPLCIGIVVASAAARNFALSLGADPIDLYVLSHYRADTLAAGALVAYALRAGWLAGRGRQALWVSAAALGGLIVVCWIDGDSGWAGPAMQRVGYSLLAVAGTGLVIAAIMLAPSGPWPRFLSSGWLVAFGKYSYAIYLFHLPVMRVVRAFVLGPQQFGEYGSIWGGQLLFYGLATAPAFALAWISWRVFEAPLLRLKSWFPYASGDRHASAPSVSAP